MRANRLLFLLATGLSPLSYAQSALLTKPLLSLNPAVFSEADRLAIAPIAADQLMKLDLYAPDLQPPSKAGIASKPLSVRDPKTGKDIPATTIIETFNGKKAPASQYYAELNAHEKFLSSLGYDIQRGEDEDYGTIQKPLSMLSFKLDQEKNVLASFTAPEINIQDLAKFTVPDFNASIKATAATLGSTLAGPILASPLSNACTSADSVNKPLDWKQRLGDSNFNVDMKAGVRFEATCNRVAGTSEAAVGGAVFKKSFNVFTTKIASEAVRDKYYKIDLDVFVVGKKVYDFDKSQPNSFSKSDSYSGTPVDFSNSVRIPIGPVNLAINFGVKGGAKFNYNVKFDGLSALASVEPNINSSVFVEAGLDAIVAEAGAGAQFVLVKIAVPVSALAEVTPRSGVLNLHGKLFGHVDFVALDGKIYAYVKVYVPRWGIPPWKKKTYSKTLAEWDGYKVQRTLFNLETFAPIH